MLNSICSFFARGTHTPDNEAENSPGRCGGRQVYPINNTEPNSHVEEIAAIVSSAGQKKAGLESSSLQHCRSASISNEVRQLFLEPLDDPLGIPLCEEGSYQESVQNIDPALFNSIDGTGWVFVTNFEPYETAKRTHDNFATLNSAINKLSDFQKEREYIKKALRRFIYKGESTVLLDVKIKLMKRASEPDGHRKVTVWKANSSPEKSISLGLNTLERYEAFLDNHQKIIEDLQAIYADFNQQLETALDRVWTLRHQFLKKHKNNRPKINKETGLLTCSSEALEISKELVQALYPSILSLSNTIESDILLTRIFQKIMCPPRLVDTTPLPHSPFCFLITNGGNSTEKVEEAINKGVSVVEHYATLAKKAYKEFSPVHINEAIGAFWSDVIHRKSSIFVCGDIVANDNYAKAISGAYVNYLLSNPGDIPELVREMQYSNLNRVAQQAAQLSSEQLFSLKGLECLLKMVERVQEEEANDLLDACRLREDVADQLSSMSGCTRDQVASLLPAKFLQVFLVMNQAFLFEMLNIIHLLLSKSPQFHPAHMHKAVYRFSPDLKSLIVEDVYTPCLFEGFYHMEGVGPQIKPMLPLAQVKTVLTIPSLMSVENHQVTKHMEDIRFSWRAMPSVVNAFSL